MALERLARYKFYLRQRPVVLVLLASLGVAFFLVVTILSRAYQAQRATLGNRWFTRGVADLNSRKYDAAVTEFRAALLYSRDEYSYQLDLAEALIGLRHRDEAFTYLMNLRDREPDNGLVNVELARIAADQGRADAIRYYHDAVYAAWPQGEESNRRAARLELIEFLLRNHRDPEAQSELIALAANVGDNPEQQAHVGDLFLRANDYDHALAAYRASLRLNRNNGPAQAGAGFAAFELGKYAVAVRYLQDAVSANQNDTQSADRLKTAELVLRLDPFRSNVSVSERNRIVVDAFITAGARLKNCNVPVTQGNSAAGSSPSASDDWNRLKPQITEVGLRRSPDLAGTAMDLVFRIERETSNSCEKPAGADLALLLISKLHEGS